MPTPVTRGRCRRGASQATLAGCFQATRQLLRLLPWWAQQRLQHVCRPEAGLYGLGCRLYGHQHCLGCIWIVNHGHTNARASYAGNATYSCRNGTLVLAGSTCTYQTRPPLPPSQSWTTAYIGQGSRGHAFPGTGGDHTPDYAGVEATVRSDGSILVVGIQGGWTGMSCNAPRPY